MAFPLIPIAAGLGGLAGLFGGGGAKPPSAALLAKLFGPGALSRDTLQLYNMLAQSPQFRQMLQQNAITGQQFQGNLSSGLAQRGLDTSGIGTIANAAGQSAIQTGETALRGGLFGQAGDLAQSNLLARLQAFSQGQNQNIGRPSFLGQIGGNVLGAAIPYLFQTGQGGGGSSGNYGGLFGRTSLGRSIGG